MAMNLGVIKASSATTTAGNSNDLALPGFAEFASVLISVTAIGGTSPTLTPAVQWSNNDGATWFASDPADVFTTISAVSNVVKSFQVRGTSMRLAWPLPGGTTPSLTFSASVVVTGSRPFN